MNVDENISKHEQIKDVKNGSNTIQRKVYNINIIFIIQHFKTFYSLQTPQRRSVFAPKPRDDLISCKNCSRNFAEDRIEKHETICFKTSARKRKTFDMTKVRLKDTEAAQFLKSKAQHLEKTAKV